MGMYLNQLPPTEVARLKAELAETLIAHFCYPRFYDYRAAGLRMRPVDRAKRQEVWQYLNAVDFNVWGRVDVDSPDFQRQVERLLIHFVQRNRSFFGQQGRKRMADVRALITHCSTALADGLRGHLRGQSTTPSFGTPRPVFSWSGTRGTGAADLSWEQVLNGTMQLQQQMQEVRGELPAGVPATPVARPGAVPSRRTRTTRPTPSAGGPRSNGGGAHEEEGPGWSGAGGRKGPLISGEIRYPPASGETGRAGSPPGSGGGVRGGSSTAYASLPDASPTMPLPLGKPEQIPVIPPTPVEASSPLRARRSRSAEIPAAPAPLPRALAQPVAYVAAAIPVRPSQPLAPVGSTELSVQQAEGATALTSDEDVVIFEQMRLQLVVWLRVEAVHAGIELGEQGALQLVEALRQQDGTDATRLQIVSTLLGVCDQVMNCGHATLFDYKQAMMFYLMHTRRSR
ncbi:MAG TPA: hypothetical protein VGF67_22050 [Ktedonobacteraceae bacterium]|jgi:hypothetical protein